MNVEIKMQFSDVQVVRNLGRGAYGEVLLVKVKSNDKTYALKCIDKKLLAKVSNITKIEKKINFRRKNSTKYLSKETL